MFANVNQKRALMKETMEYDFSAKSLIALVLILIGFSLFIFNYERETVELDVIQGELIVIDYYAPLWDPLPHHVNLKIEAQGPINVIIELENGGTKSETHSITNGEKKVDVYPGERIQISIENPEGQTGFLWSVLWCDSWNYGAALLILSGAVLLLLDYSASTRGAR